MKSIEERVRNVKIDPRYDAHYEDFREVYEMAETDLSGALITYFKFGYMKGQRATASEAKKERMN